MRMLRGRNVAPRCAAWLGCLVVGAACEELVGLDWRPADGRGRFLASTLLDTLGHPMPARPPEGSNTIVVSSPLDGHFAGWSKDSWGGALQLQLGDRVKIGDNLALLQTNEGVIEAVSSPKNGTIVAMLSLDINSQVDPGMPLVLLEPRISGELEAGAPSSSKTSPARTEQPVSNIGPQVLGTGNRPDAGGDTDKHGPPVWAWPLAFVAMLVLLAACMAKFCQFVSLDKPCSSTKEGDYHLTADDIEQDPLMAGIQRSARDSEPSTPRQAYTEAGLAVEFATKADASQVICFTHKPLGMLFFKSWWKNGLKVAGFKEPSHAKQLGVQVGWVITKVGRHSVVGMQYKEASEILRLAVEDLPELDGHSPDEDAHLAGSPPESFQRLPIEEARQMPQPPTDSEESRQAQRLELGERAVPVASGGGLMFSSQDSENTERSATRQQSELSIARPLFSDPRPLLQAGPGPADGSSAEDQVAAALGGSFRPDPGLRPGESEVSASFPLLDAHHGSGTPEESTQIPSQAVSRGGFAAVEEEESLSPGSRAPRVPELRLELVTTYNKKQVVTITHRPLGMLFYKSFWKSGLKVAGFKKHSHARDQGVQPSWFITRAGDVDLTSMKYKEASRALKAAVAHLPLMEGAESEGEDSTSTGSRDSSREGSLDPAHR